jgi:hypothetical protein
MITTIAIIAKVITYKLLNKQTGMNIPKNNPKLDDLSYAAPVISSYGL